MGSQDQNPATETYYVEEINTGRVQILDDGTPAFFYPTILLVSL